MDKKETLLKQISTIQLAVGCIAGVISIICGFVFDSPLIFIAIGIATIFSSIIIYAFLQVIVEMSLTLKANSEDNKNFMRLFKDAVASIERNAVRVPDMQEPFTPSKDIVKPQDEKIESTESDNIITPQNADIKFNSDLEGLEKWKLMKKEGLTEQAINEYVEDTGLSREDAVEFFRDL